MGVYVIKAELNQVAVCKTDKETQKDKATRFVSSVQTPALFELRVHTLERTFSPFHCSDLIRITHTLPVVPGKLLCLCSDSATVVLKQLRRSDRRGVCAAFPNAAEPALKRHRAPRQDTGCEVGLEVLCAIGRISK